MIRLDEIELRVLGVLMEKALTQPSSYPLTLNALLLGANQKQNREPVTELTEGQVAAALQRLMDRHVVEQASPAVGARANRFQHKAVEVFHWDRREQAVMAELMLRGRQTAGELRTRASRMTDLPDLEAVHHVLESLRGAGTPWIEELPREPGRSANRFRHLLGGPDASGQAPRVAEVVASRPDDVSSGPAPAGDAALLVDLSGRVEELERSVLEIRELLATLRTRTRQGDAPEL